MAFGRKKEKTSLKETEKEKRARKSVLDPSKAIHEEEPFLAAQGYKSGIASYRFKDLDGNDIVDPDRSNPTRHRLERPLDTIRSFERAIYKDDDIMKRSSHYQAADGSHRSTYHDTASRRASMIRQMRPPDNYYSQKQPKGQSYDNRDPRMYSNSRQQLPPANVDQQHYNYDQAGGGYSPSAETAGTGSGSSGSRAWSNNDPASTNPSSDASSYRGTTAENAPQVPKKTPSPLSRSQAAYNAGGQQPNGDNTAGSQYIDLHGGAYQQHPGYFQQAQPNFQPSSDQYQEQYNSQQQPSQRPNLTKQDTTSSKTSKRASWFKRTLSHKK